MSDKGRCTWEVVRFGWRPGMASGQADVVAILRCHEHGMTIAMAPGLPHAIVPPEERDDLLRLFDEAFPQLAYDAGGSAAAADLTAAEAYGRIMGSGDPN